ncbi:MAG TPA: HD domain-containing phosphohydrolase [Nitrospiria bacterium]|jgi:putative nucleotidyltransferase with HDIG domain
MQTKPNILIVDDEAGPRESLKMILKPFYGIYTAETGGKALQIVEKEEIDLVTLDLKMPDLHGTEVLREIKKLSGDVEVVIITGFGSLKSAVEGIRFGASDYLLKPFNVSEIVSIINRTLEKKRLYDQLKGFLQDLGNLVGLETNLNEVRNNLSEKYSFLEEVKRILDKNKPDLKEEATIGNLEFAKTLAELFESKDLYSKGHSTRVSHYALLVAQELNLSQKQKEILQMGAYIHDIGKIGIDNKIILKEEKFTEEEREVTRKHPIIGVDLVSPIGIPPEVLEVIRHHHERFDGLGYPDGLKQQKIPLLARILTVADAFDSMVNDQPYRTGMPIGAIQLELETCSGTQFDPDIVQTFLSIIREEKDKLLPLNLNESTS